MLQVGFQPLFLHPNPTVMWGFQHFMVYKLLRFHRHHAQNSSDLDLLTSIGSKLLHVSQVGS